MAEILCSTCGKPNTDDHNFCDHCGAPLFSVDPLPPDSPSLRDDLFDNNDDTTPDQSSELLDEARLDSLLSPQDPLEKAPEDPQKSVGSLDEYSRLDDLIPAPEPEDDPPVEEEPQPVEESDASSRLDDFFATDDPFTGTEEEEKQSDPPAFDPFLEPAARDQLFGEESPGDTSGGEWEYLTEPSAEDNLSEKSPPVEEHADNLDFLSSLSDDSASEMESPAKEPGEERDFLSSLSAEDEQHKEETEKRPVGEWEFLSSSSTEEEPAREEELSKSPVDEWDLTPDADEEPPKIELPELESDDGLGFLEALDGEEYAAGPEQPAGEPQGDLDFLTPDPDSEPGPIGFRPDLYDEDEDPIPEFGSPGFSDDSGWLDMLQDPESREAAKETLAEPSKPQTDWLDKIKRLNKSSDLVEEDSSFPDWLSVSDKPAEELPEKVQPPEYSQPPADSDDAAPASDLPAWLKIDGDDESLNAFLRKKDRTNEEYKPSIVRGITDKLPQEDDDEPASGLSDSQQIKFPSWAEEKKAAEKAAENQESLAESEEDADPIIDPFQADEEDIFDDLFSDELPGWLTSASTDSAFEDFEEELSHGELPGWVEAMRPVVESTDATGLSEDEDYIENYGPLAGIPSVLPAEAEVAFDPERAARKPLDLFATKNHQDYVNILKKLISDENKTKIIQKPAPVATQRVLRWLIAIILLVTTTGTIVFGGILDADPPTTAQVQNTGYGALYEQIESLYDGQPVLIAFDYQPASAGELHTAAAGVVDHLMKQGTYLSFISTQPTGPALADHFLATTQEQHKYIHTQQYINLGYLPGESAGLLSFVIAPKQIIPLAFDGSNAWGSPPLLRVDSINDFAMILVITDDPDTAKIWIEQVATFLEDTPLNMVVSALAEPLIQPYFRSSPQLVKGYVSGIIDSMNYEQLLKRPNLATTAWLPFNLGIIITVGTMFIGGLANGVLSLFSRHRARAAGDNK